MVGHIGEGGELAPSGARPCKGGDEHGGGCANLVCARVPVLLALHVWVVWVLGRVRAGSQARRLSSGTTCWAHVLWRAPCAHHTAPPNPQRSASYTWTPVKGSLARGAAAGGTQTCAMAACAALPAQLTRSTASPRHHTSSARRQRHCSVRAGVLDAIVKPITSSGEVRGCGWCAAARGGAARGQGGRGHTGGVPLQRPPAAAAATRAPLPPCGTRSASRSRRASPSSTTRARSCGRACGVRTRAAGSLPCLRARPPALPRCPPPPRSLPRARRAHAPRLLPERRAAQE